MWNHIINIHPSELLSTKTIKCLLTKDAKMFANSFVRLLYSHIKRNDNGVAHSLVKNALCIPDFQVWMEDVSSHIVSILQLDVF